MAEARSGQIDLRPGSNASLAPKTTAELKREIADIRTRISRVVDSAERRISSAAGAEDFDHIPTGWRGFRCVAEQLVRRVRQSRAASSGLSSRVVMATGVAIALTVTLIAVRRTRARGSWHK